MATLVLPSENVVDDAATMKSIVEENPTQTFNPCVGAERGDKSSGETAVDAKLEEKQVVEKSVFEWEPFDFPFPTQPYAGPGSFAHNHYLGRFLKDYTKEKTIIVQFYDSIGIRIGQINLDPRKIIEVNKETCVDKDGYVKIFPIATDINQFDTQPRIALLFMRSNIPQRRRRMAKFRRYTSIVDTHHRRWPGGRR